MVDPPTDESLTPESLYYYVINIKESGADSLIELDFASHTAQESLQEARVPDGVAYYTLEGHLSQLDVVFLHRFLQVCGCVWAEKRMERAGHAAIAATCYVDCTSC